MLDTNEFYKLVHDLLRTQRLFFEASKKANDSSLDTEVIEHNERLAAGHKKASKLLEAQVDRELAAAKKAKVNDYFYTLVAEMRKAQKDYFKAASGPKLQACIRLETNVRERVAAYRQPTLF